MIDGIPQDGSELTRDYPTPFGDNAYSDHDAPPVSTNFLSMSTAAPSDVPGTDFSQVPKVKAPAGKPAKPALSAKSRKPASRSAAPKTDDDNPFTDLGNAKRLTSRWGKNLHYVHSWKQWLIWDGLRWQKDTNGGIQRAARETIQHLKLQAKSLPDEKEAKILHDWALKCESYARLSAMVTLTADEPDIPIGVDALDDQPMRLTVLNGTIDLTTGKLLPASRADFITKLAPVHYDLDAKCPLWEAFLDKILNHDKALIAFMQRVLGYAMTGDSKRRVLTIFYGDKGRNGKSTLIDTIHTMLGEYAMNTSPETLMAKHGDTSNTSDIARLRGARFVAARESEEGHRLSEAVIKQMTGGDVMTARLLYQDFFDFKPQFKLFLATNHAPVIRATDDGFWDRIRMVPFTVRIPDAELDRELPDKLLKELPGILAWCVRGCVIWGRDGLGSADAVDAATEDYRTDNDSLGLFLDMSCVLLPHARVQATALYKAYEAWCADTGNYVQKQTAFGRKLTERGILAERSGGLVYRVGVGLTSQLGQ